MLTDFAVMNIFHGISVPMPCITKIKNTNLYLSVGGSISIFALSIVIPLKFSSSFGRLVSSQAANGDLNSIFN
jgi:hypothetical protein